ncbi:MAG: patatin-like phospholipase family protein [Gammaproteobacteria bacterium]
MYELDKYIFGEFFKHRSTPMDIMGSSAGAFRTACFCQSDPVAAVDRLAKNYSETVYSDEVDRYEITEKALELLDAFLAESGITEIINNPRFKAHFLVAKCSGFVASEHKMIQGLGLAKSYLNNRLSRRNLTKQYERYIYQTDGSNLVFDDPDNIPTQQISLTEDNLRDALLASGSIPMVMAGIKDIAGSPEGLYRDGGIIDYHFDLKFKTDGLVLYPHFNSHPKAGWFDKKLKRPVRAANYDNVVLLCPSEKFIANLPYQKIPDRTDFSTMDANQRMTYWKQVLAETQRLADDFAQIIETQDLSVIKPFNA